MDKNLLINLTVLSLLLGTIFGIIASIPYVGILGLIGALLLVAPLVMLYLIMDSKLELTTIKDSIVNGALIGFVSSIFYSISYAIIVVLLDKIFHYTNNLILTSMIEHSPVWLFLLVIIFMGVIYATTNAFSGFITYYIINLIRDVYEKEHPQHYEEETNDRV